MIIALLLMTTLANGASLERKVEKLLNAPAVSQARELCTENVVHNTDDAATKDLCAEAFLELAEQTDTLAGWQSYRARWGDTKWSQHGLNREAELALTALGYEAPEEKYRALSRQYKATPTGQLAMERAAQVAINSIKTKSPDKRGRYAKFIAGRYPDRAAELQRDYPSAFEK